MSLIKSISGIRGTIGGKRGEGLSGLDVVKFTCGYASFVKNNSPESNTIVVGRDARVSGKMIFQLVSGALMSMGFDVIDIGLATTPTTEIAVKGLNADGGIIITASHNPLQWNALKLLDRNGEFLNDEEGRKVLNFAEEENFIFAEVDRLGKLYKDDTWLNRHINMIESLKLVDKKAISSSGIRVAVDAVNSIGGIAIPALLRSLGIKEIIELNCDTSGVFKHNPEPLPENLKEISDLMKSGVADVGFVVDPDVDRLAIVMENGEMFVEENTLVAIADYILDNTPGSSVSNLSSTRALKDICRKKGCRYEASAVGEVNVVSKMKEIGAVIGGEGNGGIIYPELHYGRDALVGVALFLTLLVKSGKKVSELKKKYPQYYISKNKIQLTEGINVDKILQKVKDIYKKEEITDIDGIKIDFSNGWVHLRKSNTEPIIRIYSEAPTKDEAEVLAEKIKKIIIE